MQEACFYLVLGAVQGVGMGLGIGLVVLTVEACDLAAGALASVWRKKSDN